MKKRYTEKIAFIPMKKVFTSLSKLVLTSCTLCLCLLFNTTLIGQIVLTTDDANNGKKTIDCSSSAQLVFTDDGIIDGLYHDSIARMDTIILCPSDTVNNQIKVTFTDFGLADGDSLSVYDCNLSATTCAAKAKVSGQGVSSAFGGWVQATCDRSINPSGCLSFVFSVNGDKAKDIGWEGWITCENDKTQISCPTDIIVTDECNDLDGLVMVTIPKPTITACDGNTSPMVMLTSTCATIPTGAVAADGGNLGNFNLPLGTHTITATAVSDPSVSCTYKIIVDQPTIVCNDRVQIAGGFNCPSRIGVDDILENPCVGTGTTYRLEMDLGATKGGIISATVDGTSLNSLRAGGLDFSLIPISCQTEYPITVTRIVKFNNCAGVQDSLTRSCSSIFQISEETPALRLNTTSIVACNRITNEELKSRLDMTLSCNVNPDSVSVNIVRFSGNLCGAAAVILADIRVVSYCGVSVTDSLTVINIERPSSFFPPADTTVTCTNTLEPAMTGFPLIDTDGDGVGDLDIDNDCDYFAIYTDQRVVDATTNQQNIHRTWTILDRCNLRPDVVLAPQVIKITATKPVFNCPAASETGGATNPIIFYTDNNACEQTVNLVPPTAIDSCLGTVTVIKVRTINQATQTVHAADNTTLPVGNYYTQYVAINDTTGVVSDTCQIYFTITQQGGINAICVDELNASFSDDGFARIRVEDIDLSGENECVIYTKEVRKENGEWGQIVSLNCSEIANNIKVYLRVRDSEGASNTCWTRIKGKDTAPPVCTDLEDMEFVCEDFHAEDFGTPTDTNFDKEFDEGEWKKLTPSLLDRYNEIFGNPICTDNLSACFEPIILQQYQLIPANCGETKIKRRYAAFDELGNFTEFKEQLITVTFEQNFTVNFPADWTGDCGAEFPEANLDLVTKGCTVLGWTHEDKRFDNVDGACYLLERTYTVINWCNFEVNGSNQQIARVEDEHGFSAAINTVTSETLANVGRFSYTQILKVSDNDAPIIVVETVDTCLTSDGCMEEKIFAISAEDCTKEERLVYNYEFTQNGTVLQSGVGKTFNTSVSQGTYEVKWSVNDDCGNTAWETISYTFKDCRKPVPYCLDGVAITVGDADNAALIWATDITQNSSDNCTPEDQLEYRVWHRALGDAVIRPKSNDAASVVLALPTSIALDCNYLGTQAIDLYVIDEAGNWSYCIASVEVQDNANACGMDTVDPEPQGMAVISGRVTNTKGIALSEVVLSVEGANSYETTIATDVNGQYELTLPTTQDYTINLNKEGSLVNGVSVFDLVLISKHILGKGNFDTPYKYFAADVNQSGTVTAFDMVILRQIILGLKTSFDQTTNWRFIKANHEFLTNNPISENYVETVTFQDLTNSLAGMDFVAIKSGDIDGSAKIDGFTSGADRNRTGILQINIADKKIKRGAIVTVDLKVTDLRDIEGFQYALTFTDLTLQKVSEGILNTSNFAKKGDDALAIVWTNDEVNLKDNALLKLHFVAHETGLLSEFLQLSNRHLESEAVNNEEQLLDVQLNFEKSSLEKTTTLFQNRPNPFSKETSIGFHLTTASPVVFEIFNQQGARLKMIRGDFEQGYHELKIQEEELNSSGILWYRIQTSDGIYAKKMVALD